jgi:O-acetyl-ADP-ribose deacetylase (regulator of RNase III)
MKHKIGDLVKEVHDGIIIHQCNAQGVMNSGIAKQLRETYPIVYDDYIQEFCKHGNLLGKIIVSAVSPDLVVISVVGQFKYGRDKEVYTSYVALSQAFLDIKKLIKDLDVEIHHPLIGCGLGGGDWDVVSKIIEDHLGHETTLWMLP